MMLGGPGGSKMALDEADALFLPAGTGHCRLSGSNDFQVVAAYPPDQHWDVRREAIDRTGLREMLNLPLPKSDPILGARGPLAGFSR